MQSAILMTSSSASLATITIHAQQLNDVWDHSRPRQLSNLQAVILEERPFQIKPNNDTLQFEKLSNELPLSFWAHLDKNNHHLTT